MPDYHKQFIGELSQVSYHIIGYGSYYEEALIKYLGESIERYATVIAGDLLSDRIVYASYNELKLLHKSDAFRIFASVYPRTDRIIL